MNYMTELTKRIAYTLAESDGILGDVVKMDPSHTYEYFFLHAGTSDPEAVMWINGHNGKRYTITVVETDKPT